jgi:hypothetical protein
LSTAEAFQPFSNSLLIPGAVLLINKTSLASDWSDTDRTESGPSKASENSLSVGLAKALLCEVLVIGVLWFDELELYSLDPSLDAIPADMGIDDLWASIAISTSSGPSPSKLRLVQHEDLLNYVRGSVMAVIQTGLWRPSKGLFVFREADVCSFVKQIYYSEGGDEERFCELTAFPLVSKS